MSSLIQVMSHFDQNFMNYDFVLLKLKYPTDIDGSTEDRRYFKCSFFMQALWNIEKRYFNLWRYLLSTSTEQLESEQLLQELWTKNTKFIPKWTSQRYLIIKFRFLSLHLDRSVSKHRRKPPLKHLWECLETFVDLDHVLETQIGHCDWTWQGHVNHIRKALARAVDGERGGSEQPTSAHHHAPSRATCDCQSVSSLLYQGVRDV